ncbi:hypothetical protein CIPAW_09G218100 [Carya illinoinensis]|uniref:peroxidase n=1 Tax=Carya illinoinensis TaxID=32201 RepID=A0A8T1PPT7_CARIL|nr:hypothetical protein CIPAW_09G218100 [Carya illinoinensis]KAG6697860.1 hypothetical protein I3842_09G222000 [Carya illinoinensis]
MGGPQHSYHSTACSFLSTTTKLCLLFSLLVRIVSSQLSSNLYATSCPNVLFTIKSGVDSAVSSEKRMGAFLLRLHFHDYFVQGCDASVLLNKTEKVAGPNYMITEIIKIFIEVEVDYGTSQSHNMKIVVEKLCLGVVSCADILAVYVRDFVVALGGPSWTVQFGRRDSTTSSSSTFEIPGAQLDLRGLINAFLKKGFTTKEMVALSGQARCRVFRTRIYTETNIESSFATSLQSNCPSTGDAINLCPLDATSPTSFDNAYFKNLVAKKGLLHSDQQLFGGASFLTDFANAMVKMGNLSPLAGSSG